MISRRKLIKGLECCSEHGGKCPECPECPYNVEGVGIGYCTTKVTKDALTLLKADQVELIRQRERIETLERIVDRMEQSINESLQYLKIIAMKR